MTDKIISILPEEPEVSLETQNLILRKLHTEALQMLVVMGKNLLSSQQHLITIQQQMRKDYAAFDAFMNVNAARLNGQDNESRN